MREKKWKVNFAKGETAISFILTLAKEETLVSSSTSHGKNKLVDYGVEQRI
jgi:hypothetical protein